MHLTDPTPVPEPGPIHLDVIDTLPTWINAAAAALTAIGLVVLGLWAIYRYQRGRTFRPRCSITVTPTIIRWGPGTGIAANVVIRNCGDAVLRWLPTDKARVEVALIDRDPSIHAPGSVCITWPDSPWQLHEDLLAQEDARLDIFELEPNQDMHRGCLFQISQDWAAARVSCVVSVGEGDDRREWTSSSILMRDAE